MPSPCARGVRRHRLKTEGRLIDRQRRNTGGAGQARVSARSSDTPPDRWVTTDKGRNRIVIGIGVSFRPKAHGSANRPHTGGNRAWLRVGGWRWSVADALPTPPVGNSREFVRRVFSQECCLLVGQRWVRSCVGAPLGGREQLRHFGVRDRSCSMTASLMAAGSLCPAALPQCHIHHSAARNSASLRRRRPLGYRLRLFTIASAGPLRLPANFARRSRTCRR
jgi:hypothetical protein